jgi:Kef-type K+ transport system membrane component KefB
VPLLHPAPVHPSGSALAAFLLLDLMAIVLLANVLGGLAARLGQPRAVGEILAGVLLGPTVMGQDLSRFVTPQEVRPALSGIATLALVLFMFLVGVEFQRSSVKGREGQAVSLGLMSVLVPAGSGFAVALALHTPLYAGHAGRAVLPFALFIGACLSVTALPVIAHVLLERGELNTPIGSVAMAAAVVASAAMFGFIALTSAVARAGGYPVVAIRLALVAVLAIGGRARFGRLVRSLLRRNRTPGNGLSKEGMVVVFGGLLLSALAAEVLGVNMMVGAFVWGALMPREWGFRRWLADRLEPLASVLFLPAFYAYAGLSANLRLLRPPVLPVLGLVLVVAVATKMAAALPGRLYGMSWREVGQLGALMNTRGLVLLVVGLTGLEMRLITPVAYTIVVVVGLATNVMTGPLLGALATRRRSTERRAVGPLRADPVVAD